MNWFIAISALLLAGILVFLLRPLLRGAEQATEGAEARAVNLAILREQRAELERELAGGSIDKVTYEHAVGTSLSAEHWRMHVAGKRDRAWGAVGR